MNLRKETLEKLDDWGYKPEHVKWVGNSKKYCTWEEFEKNADFEYDNGYGGNDIALSLVVVGEDWWLERHEYDGSEWWEFKKLPKLPEEKGEVKIKELQA